jgi:sulfur transfer protein SufE
VRRLTNAAVFNHSIALYEIFLKKYITYLLQYDERAKKIFQSKWSKLINKGPDHYRRYGIDASILLDEDEMLTNYKVLCMEDKQSLDRFLLGALLGQGRHKEDTYIDYHSNNTFIMRYIRNAFVHRTTSFDKTLINDFNNNKYISKSLALEKFISFNINYMNGNQDDIDDCTKLINERIRYNYFSFVRSLIFMACWFSMHAFKAKDNKTIDRDFYTPLGGIYYSLIESCIEMKNAWFSQVGIEVFESYLKYIHFHDKSKIEDFDRFNYLLLSDLVFRRKIKDLKRFARFENLKQKNQLVLQIADLRKQRSIEREEQQSHLQEFSQLWRAFESEDDDKTKLAFLKTNCIAINNGLKCLLEAYLDGLKQNFINAFIDIPFFDEDELDKALVWYIFIRYKKDKIFKAALKDKRAIFS